MIWIHKSQTKPFVTIIWINKELKKPKFNSFPRSDHMMYEREGTSRCNNPELLVNGWDFKRLLICLPPVSNKNLSSKETSKLKNTTYFSPLNRPNTHTKPKCRSYMNRAIGTRLSVFKLIRFSLKYNFLALAVCRYSVLLQTLCLSNIAHWTTELLLESWRTFKTRQCHFSAWILLPCETRVIAHLPISEIARCHPSGSWWTAGPFVQTLFQLNHYQAQKIQRKPKKKDANSNLWR